MSDGAELDGIVAFLRSAERLKVTRRSAFTSTGEVESVAEHTWRLAIMALVLGPSFPEVDRDRLIRICLVHDLGEALSGDIPAPEQDRRREAGRAGKAPEERRDFVTLVAPLPAPLRNELIGLWDDYRFNLGYGRRYTASHPLVVQLRALLDRETERRAAERTPGSDPEP